MSTSHDIKRLAKGEATHTAVYSQLAKSEKNESLRNLFLKLATYDLKHSEFWASAIDEKEIGFSRLKVTLYLLIRRLFEVKFAVKLLERGEHQAFQRYREKLNEDKVFRSKKNQMQEVINDEFDHEAAIIEVIKDERAEYVGPIVLGLNDALMELVGVIAGLVSAVSNNLFIGFSGLVVGIASALSMASSYYLSSDLTEGEMLNSLKGGICTGASYF